MQLDDWVLCRVRQKTNINNSRNTWEDRTNCPIYENQDGYFDQRLDDDHRQTTCPKSITTTTTSQNLEMIIDYMYKDFPMLPYIFPTPQIPNYVETDSSSISFQSSGENNPKSCDSIREDGSKKIGQFSSVSGSDQSLFSQRKSKLGAREKDDKSNYVNLPQKKKTITNMDDHEREKLVNKFESNPETSTMTYFCGINYESKGDQAPFNDNHDWTASNLQLHQEAVVQITGTDGYDL